MCTSCILETDICVVNKNNKQIRQIIVVKGVWVFLKKKSA